jgi:hypothetical protein
MPRSRNSKPATPQYRKRWRLDQARGIKRFIDPEPCARHIAILREAGWSNRSIAAAAGVAADTIGRMAKDRAKYVNRNTAVKILAINPEQVPAKASNGHESLFVPRVGTQRRIQALLFMGWPYRILHGYGINSSTLYQKGNWVDRRTHDAVAEAYAQLVHTVGPSERTRRAAVKAGYVGPLAWEDIDLDAGPILDDTVGEDDGDGYLDEAAIMRRMEGEKIRLTKAEAGVLVRRWHASGRSLGDCERVTGIKPDRHFHLSDLEQEEAS